MGLIRDADCYVSLHHAEGFGLTIAEAMAYGKPVIATGYSGNMEFTNANNALLVRYAVNDVAHHDDFYGPVRWAIPDVNHAAELMGQVARKEPFIQGIQSNALKSIQEKLSPQSVGELMKQRLLLLLRSR
jgi:glycosyltransferase involved in cell wall biosynthesis